MTSNHIAHTILSHAHPPAQAATLFTDRVQHKPLFLRPTSPTPDDNRNRRRLHRLRKKSYFLRKQKPKPLSAREKRVLGLYELPREECRYDVFLGLHRMWTEYMQEVLDLKGKEKDSGGGGRVVTPVSHGSKLVSADMHGAFLEVVRSRCSSRVGLKGIVVRDTKFTFLVVGPGDVVKCKLFSPLLRCMAVDCWIAIPKEHTVFRFMVPLPRPRSGQDDGQDTPESKELVFELHGSQFQNRAVDRANKKFKWRNVDYL